MNNRGHSRPEDKRYHGMFGIDINGLPRQTGKGIRSAKSESASPASQSRVGPCAGPSVRRGQSPRPRTSHHIP